MNTTDTHLDKHCATLRHSQKALLKTAQNLFQKKLLQQSLHVYIQLLTSKNLNTDARKAIKQKIKDITDILHSKNKNFSATNIPELVDNLSTDSQHDAPEALSGRFINTLEHSVTSVNKGFQLFLMNQLLAKRLEQEEHQFDESEVWSALKLAKDFISSPVNKAQIYLKEYLIAMRDGDEEMSQNAFLEQDPEEDSAYEDHDPLVHEELAQSTAPQASISEYPMYEVLNKLDALKNMQSKLFQKTEELARSQINKQLEQALQSNHLDMIEEKLTSDSHNRNVLEDGKKFLDFDENFFEDLETQALELQAQPGQRARSNPRYFNIDPGFFPNVHPINSEQQESLQDSFEDLNFADLYNPTPQNPPQHLTPPPQNTNTPKDSDPQKVPLSKRISLTYNFKNLFNSRFYKKYRSMLNEAAALVARHELDEALELYNVVQSQSIPPSFKKMVQRNIEDIESAISDTFLLSDTIVQVDDRGKIHNVELKEDK